MTPKKLFPNIFSMCIKKRSDSNFKSIEKVSRKFSQRKLEDFLPTLNPNAHKPAEKNE
jgi:hypothetical protein